jgi:hypothetical protein
MAETGGDAIRKLADGQTDRDRDTDHDGGLAQAHLLYRNMALGDLGPDTRTGLSLALYRTFAVPRIAELLEHTGEIRRQPHKRTLDTGILMYELIAAGTSAPRGREVIRMLNKMHHRWPITDEDYRYVLTTFIVVPTRWIDQHGARATTDAEKEAVTVFYGEVGRLMAIKEPPTTYRDAAQLLDSYEAANVAYSPAGAALMSATQHVVADRLPPPLRRLGPTLTALMLPDKICAAVGTRTPTRVERAVFRHAMRARALVARRHRGSSAPIFTPGHAGRSVYPDGYQLEMLGVQDDRRTPSSIDSGG